MRNFAFFALICTFGTAFTQEFSEDGQLDDQRTWNGNTNFNNLGNFGNFGNLFTNQNIGTWYALLGALLLGEKEFWAIH